MDRHQAGMVVIMAGTLVQILTLMVLVLDDLGKANLSLRAVVLSSKATVTAMVQWINTPAKPRQMISVVLYRLSRSSRGMNGQVAVVVWRCSFRMAVGRSRVGMEEVSVERMVRVGQGRGR